MGIITEPGLYPNLSSADYHADPVCQPSVSSGLLKVILNSSLAHARLAHPRLNPDYEREEKRAFDLGHVAHQLILGDTNTIRVINPKNHPNADGKIPEGWTNKAMQEARKKAYKDNVVPLLPDELAQAEKMASAVRKQLDDAGIHSFTKHAGDCEQSIFWQESGVWCRARLDWKPATVYSFAHIFDDLKTTDGSANPEAWAARQMFSIGADIQAAFYRRGIRATLGIEEPVFRFIVCEQNPPFAISIVEPSPRAYGPASVGGSVVDE